MFLPLRLIQYIGMSLQNHGNTRLLEDTILVLNIPFLIVDAEDPHLIQQRAIDTGMASFNEIKIVPLMAFDDVMSVTRKLEKS